MACVYHGLAACQRYMPSSLAAVIGLSDNDVISLRSLRCGRCMRCVGVSCDMLLIDRTSGMDWTFARRWLHRLLLLLLLLLSIAYHQRVHACNALLGLADLTRRTNYTFLHVCTITRLRIGHTRHQFVSSKRRESTGMSNLPFSSHCQAHFDRLHLFQCSTSEIFWS